VKLRPTIERRNDVIRPIRKYDPDLICTHRSNDYHPDHRYTEQLVRDSAYVATVPTVRVPTDHLGYNPVIAYLHDEFREPPWFDPDVAVPVDGVIDTELETPHRHAPRTDEWLPYDVGKPDEVPDGEAERRAWLRGDRLPDFEAVTDRIRDRLVDQYGPEGQEARTPRRSNTASTAAH